MTTASSPNLPPVELTGDHHVHSTFSDDATSTLAQNVRAASDRGLRTIRLTEHVRGSTTWVPDFLHTVAGLDHPAGLEIVTGVEAKLLDADGHLDLPDGLPFGRGGLDRVLIADHQFPGPDGPWSPRQTLENRQRGWAATDLLDLLIAATVRAMDGVPAAQLAHPFSILPKIGLSEDDLTDAHLSELGSAAARTDCLVEVNEKWACPGPRALAALESAGATLVASTDSHRHEDIGRYPRVSAMLSDLERDRSAR